MSVTDKSLLEVAETHERCKFSWEGNSEGIQFWDVRDDRGVAFTVNWILVNRDVSLVFLALVSLRVSKRGEPNRESIECNGRGTRKWISDLSEDASEGSATSKWSGHTASEIIYNSEKEPLCKLSHLSYRWGRLSWRNDGLMLMLTQELIWRTKASDASTAIGVKSLIGSLAYIVSCRDMQASPLQVLRCFDEVRDGRQQCEVIWIDS